MMGKRSAAFAVALALATVAACSSDDEPSADSTATEDPGSEESTPPESPGSAPEATDVPADGDDREIDPSLEITTISTGPPPSAWDPATSTSATQDIQWYSYVYDFLLRLTADNELVPHLATEWEYDDTSTVLTLTLRDDVTFTDGEAFTAEVAKDNLDRVRNGTGAGAPLLVGIESIEAPDDTTLVITQTGPNAKIIFALASTSAAMVSPAAIADPASLAQNPVGSGPYTLESSDAVSGTFVYNEDYWDTETVFPQRRVALSAADGNARTNAFLSGSVDFVDISQDIVSPEIQAMADAGEIGLSTIPSSPAALGINNSLPPFDNPLILQALNYALDRDLINESTYNGICEPSSQPFLPSQAGYIEGLEYEYDPDMARELIAESGVDLSQYTIKFQSVAGTPTAPVELLQSMLEDVGFQLEIVQSQVQDVFPKFFNGEFQMSVLALFLGMPDSSFVTDYLVGDRNPGKVDPELEELVATANAMDPADPDREEAYQEINQYIFDNPVLIVQCYRPRTVAASLDVVDFDQIPFRQTGGVDFARLGLAAE